MEILFSVLLLIVPVISLVALMLSLITAKKVGALSDLVKSLVQIMRGGERNPLDDALDNVRML